MSSDEIWVKAGAHYPGAAGDRSATFTLKNGVALHGGFGGSEIARIQHNWQVNRTVLSGDILTITASTLPSWLTLVEYSNSPPTFAGAPTNADVGDYPVVLRVTDSKGAFAGWSFLSLCPKNRVVVSTSPSCPGTGGHRAAQLRIEPTAPVGAAAHLLIIRLQNVFTNFRKELKK